MEEKNAPLKVCVAGGSGYIGSSLVKRLLEKGYVVNATLRNLEDASKVGLLKSLPGAETMLVLFQADLESPDEFEPAISGCQYVFLVAIPKHNFPNSKYKDMTEASVAGVRSIADSCIKSGTVKRLIYTASVLSASPLREDGSGFKPFMDESCWTPLNIRFPNSSDRPLAYTISKTFAEKEILSYNDMPKCNLEVVTLVCGMVGGDTILPFAPLSLQALASPLTGNQDIFTFGLMFLQGVVGSVPLVHIEDVCEAHIFCMESFMKGRFICAAADPTVREIASYYHQKYPIENEFMGAGAERGSRCDLRKLKQMGFKYKYGMDTVLDDNMKTAQRTGILDNSKEKLK